MSAVIRFRTDRQSIQVVWMCLRTEFAQFILVFFRFIFALIDTSLFFEERMNTAPPPSLAWTTLGTM